MSDMEAFSPREPWLRFGGWISGMPCTPAFVHETLPPRCQRDGEIDFGEHSGGRGRSQGCGSVLSNAPRLAARSSASVRTAAQSGLDLTGWVLQNRYSMLQRLEGVKTTRVLGLSWWKVATMSRNAAPELNDFTVTTNSARHPRFTQFVWGAEENDYYLKNHTVAGRRWLANDLVSTVLNVRAQGKAHQ